MLKLIYDWYFFKPEKYYYYDPYFEFLEWRRDFNKFRIEMEHKFATMCKRCYRSKKYRFGFCHDCWKEIGELQCQD